MISIHLILKLTNRCEDNGDNRIIKFDNRRIGDTLPYFVIQCNKKVDNLWPSFMVQFLTTKGVIRGVLNLILNSFLKVCTLPSVILALMSCSTICLIAQIRLVQVGTNYIFSENRQLRLTFCQLK